VIDEAQIDGLESRALHGIFNRPDSHMTSLLDWITVDSAGDCWEGHARAAILDRQADSLGVSTIQQRCAGLLILINRPHRVDDMRGRKSEAWSDHGATSRAPDDGIFHGWVSPRMGTRNCGLSTCPTPFPVDIRQLPTVRQQLRPSGPVNHLIHSPATEQAGIGSVHDRISGIGGDVRCQQQGRQARNSVRYRPALITLTSLKDSEQILSRQDSLSRNTVHLCGPHAGATALPRLEPAGEGGLAPPLPARGRDGSFATGAIVAGWGVGLKPGLEPPDLRRGPSDTAGGAGGGSVSSGAGEGGLAPQLRVLGRA
jgi:hypothetical protein